MFAIMLAASLSGVVAAWAAFTGSTSNTGSTFSIALDITDPTASAFRITDQSNCSSSSSRIRQGVAYYVCVTATDPGSPSSGVAGVTADLTELGGGASTALTSTGGPWSGYTYRATVTTAPMPTGATKNWSARITDGVGNSTTYNGQSGQTANVRSYRGWLLGEFSLGGESSLQHYWRFDETSGTVADDAVSSGADDGAYVNAPTLGASPALVGSGGLEGTAMTLDGVNDYAQVSTEGLSWLSLFGTYDKYNSVEFWFASTQGLGGSTLDPEQGAGLVDATNALPGYFNQSIGTALNGQGRVLARAGALTMESPTGFNDGKWHHVVLTMHAYALFGLGGVTADLYVDGQARDAASTGTLLADFDLPALFDVGRIASTDTNYLQGSIDEVSTYSKELSAGTVQTHYAVGCGRPDTPVVDACGL